MEKYKRYRFLSKFLIFFRTQKKRRKEILKAEHYFIYFTCFTTQEEKVLFKKRKDVLSFSSFQFQKLISWILRSRIRGEEKIKSNF